MTLEENKARNQYLRDYEFRSQESLVRELESDILLAFVIYSTDIAANADVPLDFDDLDREPVNLKKYWAALKLYSSKDLWDNVTYRLHLNCVFKPSRYETMEVTLGHVAALWAILPLWDPVLPENQVNGQSFSIQYKEEVHYQICEEVLIERDAYIKSLPSYRDSPDPHYPEAHDNNEFSCFLQEFLSEVSDNEPSKRMGAYKNLAGAFHASQKYLKLNPITDSWSSHLGTINKTKRGS